MTSYSRSLLDVVLIPPLNARFCLIDRKCWGKNRSGKFLIYSNDLTAGLLGWMNVFHRASNFDFLLLSSIFSLTKLRIGSLVWFWSL